MRITIKPLLGIVVVAFLLPAWGRGYAEKISKESITSQGEKRTYYLFVPDSFKKNGPLLVTLHGSSHVGLSLVEPWKDLASKEGFIVAGPDSSDPRSWQTPVDGPDFLYDLVEELKTKYAINPRRVYLFGHSGGAVFALGMSMLESEYFASSAVHAGAWRSPGEFKIMDTANRKIPMSIMVGDRDQFFPFKDVKATADALTAKGMTVDFTLIKGHDHNYYDIASKINPGFWTFLSKQELDKDPKFDHYNFK